MMPALFRAAAAASALTLVGACAHQPALSPLAPARAAADSSARTAIASERTLDASQLPERSVGVAPLAVAPADSALAPLGYGLADLLLTDLSRSSQLQVVDRIRVNALLQELRLAGTGRVDSSTAPRVGKLIGARRIVNGALASTREGNIAVDTRIADAAQGTLAPGAITEESRLGGILDAEKDIAFKLFTQLGVTLTPAEHAAVEQRPTRYLAAFLAYSNGVRAEALGDLALAHAWYARAVLIDPSFALARQRMDETAGSSAASGVQLGSIGPAMLSGVVDALNPSPAGTLGTIRDPGDINERATFESGQLGTIIIQIFTP